MDRGEPDEAEPWHAITERQLADREGERMPESFKAARRLRRTGAERRRWPQGRH